MCARAAPSRSISSTSSHNKFVVVIFELAPVVTRILRRQARTIGRNRLLSMNYGYFLIARRRWDWLAWGDAFLLIVLIALFLEQWTVYVVRGDLLCWKSVKRFMCDSIATDFDDPLMSVLLLEKNRNALFDNVLSGVNKRCIFLIDEIEECTCIIKYHLAIRYCMR